MNIEIEFSQINEYQKKLLIAQGEYKKFVRQFLTALAGMIIERAMPLTPVDTGTLRRSYKVTKVREIGSLIEITVYNDAKTNGVGESYASFVEKGHFTRNRVRFVEGHWMITTSTDKVKLEMQKVWDIMFAKWARRMGI